MVLCISGVVYYLATDFVVRFDVRSEEFTMIHIPYMVSEFGEPLDFIEYAGKPAFVYHKDFGQQGLVDLSLGMQPCHMCLVFNHITYLERGSYNS